MSFPPVCVCSGSLDDLDFWLSSGSKTTKSDTADVAGAPADTAAAAKSKAKKKPPTVAPVVEDQEEEEKKKPRKGEKVRKCLKGGRG